MTIRVPKDPDNLMPFHVEKAVAHALALFDQYEKKVDFDHREKTDALYRRYQLAAIQAAEIGMVHTWTRGGDEVVHSQAVIGVYTEENYQKAIDWINANGPWGEWRMHDLEEHEVI